MEEKIDIKYAGIPNVCFSLAAPYHSNEKLFSEQRKERGFDDSELWDLRTTIPRFIIPRLKEFRKIHDEQFSMPDSWKADLDKIERAFELMVQNEGSFDLTDEEYKEYEIGINLFSKQILTLWF